MSPGITSKQKKRSVSELFIETLPADQVTDTTWSTTKDFEGSSVEPMIDVARVPLLQPQVLIAFFRSRHRYHDFRGSYHGDPFLVALLARILQCLGVSQYWTQLSPLV